MSLTKLNHLQQLLHDLGPVAVAFSGGVDSSFLLQVASATLRHRCCAVTVDAPFHFRQEIREATTLIRTLGVTHHLIPFPTAQLPEMLKNKPGRCYHCKSTIITACRAVLTDAQWALVDGSNHDDLALHRPGRRALHEAAVRSPLAEVGISKQEIRELARQLKLDYWDKPAQSCLLTRFPYNGPVELEKLQLIESLEEQLRYQGLGLVRARCNRDTVMIELDLEGLAQAEQPELHNKIITTCLEAGFRAAEISRSAYTLQ